MKKLFCEIPCICVGNIELRKLKLSDAASLRELTTCDEVYRYLPTFLFEKKYDAEDAISLMYDECLEHSLILGVFCDGALCGLFEVYGYNPPFLKVSIGMRFLPAYWGRGIATKTIETAVNYLFSETKIRVITASVMPDNKASEAVLKKNGFRCVARGVPGNWGHKLPTIEDKWVIIAKNHHSDYSVGYKEKE